MSKTIKLQKENIGKHGKNLFYYDTEIKNKQVKPHQTKELLHSKRNKRNEDAA